VIDKIVSHSGAEQFPFFKPVWSAKTNGNGLTVVIDASPIHVNCLAWRPAAEGD